MFREEKSGFNPRDYHWLFHHIQQPSESLLNRFSVKPEAESKESVPLVSDIEVALALSQNKRDIICLEGGGTYFRFSVVSANKELQTLQCSGSNAHTFKVAGGNCNAIGWDKFLLLLNDALTNIKINHQNLESFIQKNHPIIVIGMAGMGAEANRQKLQTFFVDKMKMNRKSILITTDADTYLAALPAHGAVLIAGTGSICLGLNSQGERIQTGGLGAHLSGDPGSAFSVGRHAVIDCLNLKNNGRILDKVTKTFIGNDDPLYNPLLKRAKELFGEQLVTNLNTQHAERIKMAELAPLVFEYAFEQKPSSPLAKKIINETAEELAVQLGGTIDAIIRKNAALKRVPFPVILVGGIFESKHRNDLVGVIEAQLAEMCPKVQVHWEHEPNDNYVSRVVQRVAEPEYASQFSRKI